MVRSAAPDARAKSGKLTAFDNQVDAEAQRLSADQAALLVQLAAAL
jgi:hypothetical protein